jgi:2-oxoglutarate ferredoxin oxidoreductase subunit beta
VARWTTAQVFQLEKAITEALLKKGFSLIEVISPCPTYYGRKNAKATGLEMMRYYRDSSLVRHGASAQQTEIEFNGQIVVGKFLDIFRPYLPGTQDANDRTT